MTLVLQWVISKRKSRSANFAADSPRLSLKSSQIPSRAEWGPRHLLLIGFVLFLVGFLLRFPFRNQYLNGWDTSQFVLGAYHFDIPNHQPHPPGYILYVGLLRYLIPIFHDESLSVGLLSVTFSALSGVLVFLLAWEFFAEKRTAYLAACLWLVNPVLWHYSLTGDVYTAGAFGALLTVFCVHRFWRHPSERSAILVGAAFALSSGMRQDQVLFLIPVMLYPFWRSRPCRRFIPVLAAVSILGYLSWYIPTLVLTGGYQKYSQALGEHFLLSVRKTSVFFGASAFAHARMIVRMLGAIIVGSSGAFISLLLLVVYRRRKSSGLGIPKELLFFVVVWTLPALVFMSLVHFGRGGYLLPFLPGLLILLARFVAVRIPPQPHGRPFFVTALLLPALAQTYFFFAAPGLTSQLPPEPEGKPQSSIWLNRLEMVPYLFGLEARTYVYGRVREADALKQAYLPGIAEVLGRDSTVLVSFEPGIWRSLMNDFPHVPMYAVFGFSQPVAERLGRAGPMVMALGYERDTRVLFDGAQAKLAGRRATISLAGRQRVLLIAPTDMELEFLDGVPLHLTDVTPAPLPSHLRVYKLIVFDAGKGITVRSKTESIVVRP